jgi:hypothetical protein
MTAPTTPDPEPAEAPEPEEIVPERRPAEPEPADTPEEG